MPCSMLGRSRSRTPIPPEVVDYIIALMLSEARCFSTIASFSLVCHSFRQLCFRRYFYTLSVKSKTHWTNVCQISGIYGWVRTLDVTTSALAERFQNLQCFIHLVVLRVDFSTDGLHTHEGYVKIILSNLPSNAYRVLTPATKLKKPVIPQILSLEFSFLPSITPHILSMISIYCPKLQRLMLKCTDRLLPDCCWTCYEEAASCTEHSPLPDLICDIRDLTNIYGQALSPLAPTLKYLHLGIYLSAVDVFYSHTEHASLPALLPPLAPFAFLDCLPYPPSECSECQTPGYLVEEVRKTELLASAQMKAWLPMLERVCWSTWFRRAGDGYCDCGEDEKDGDETTVCWVRWAGECDKDDGQGPDDVEVRRKPW